MNHGTIVLDDTREWLETDGRGGWAASTVAGVNTRRYHGLLIAAASPPQRRFLLVNALEETLDVDGQSVRFSCHRYAPDLIDPPGYRFLTGFRLDPWPVWRYAIGDLLLEKSLFMRRGAGAVVIVYRLLRGFGPLTLRVRVLATGRDIHALHRENGDLHWTPHAAAGYLRWSPYAGVPPIHLRHNAQAYQHAPVWYRRHRYTLEEVRGLEGVEDCWSSGELTFALNAAQEQAWLALSAGSLEAIEPNMSVWTRLERDRRHALARSVPQASDAVERLVLAADQFIVASSSGAPAVIAGYPWFGVWGRDTLIALPGLMLATGRADVARGVLETLARHAQEGLIPNYLSEEGTAPSYQSVDAALWFIVAVYHWWQATGALGIVRHGLWKTMQTIIRAYWRGTSWDIGMDADGLLHVGEAATPLTWMDARVDGQAVTPRSGYAVEVQALWINALWIMAELAARLEQPRRSAAYRVMAEQAAAAFRARFWCQQGGYLYDVVNGEHRDTSVRPNQLLAISLPFICVTPTQARSIVATVERALLTPYGLRTLSPANPAYRGRCAGAPAERDAAYHQGTVWPWLLGPFVDAAVRVYGQGAKMRRRMEAWTAPLLRWVQQEGVGSLPECFDGEAPHAPRGCPAQAWSVAELLRLCVTYRIGCAGAHGGPRPLLMRGDDGLVVVAGASEEAAVL